MTLITLLICLSIERVAATSSIWQFEFYYLKMKNLLLKHLGKPQWLSSGAGMWIWLLLPVLVIQFIVGALDWLLFEFVFSVLVLLVCIGCIEKRKTYKSFLNAAARNDEEACQLYGAKLQGKPVHDENVEVSQDEPAADVAAEQNTAFETEDADSSSEAAHIEQDSAEQSSAEQSQTVDSTDTHKDDNLEQQPLDLGEPCGCETLGLTLVWYNFRYYCAVLFWFVVLGPAGAVLYCVARESADDNDDDVRSVFAKAKMQRVLHWLDWLPARVFSAGYLLIGNFTKAAGIWLSYLLDLTSPAKSLVSDISKAAEPIDAQDCSKITEPACMLKLAKRNILFFLAMVALLTLYGGIR